MKKFIITSAMLAFFGIASAQQDGQADQDKIQQEPPRPTQKQVERSAAVDAKANSVKKQSEKELEGEMRAKQKGQSQNVKTQPNSGVPNKLNDTLNPPQKKAVTPQP
ncbi:hypothetical protein HUK80_03140 [Flavobacterium sp. MAH-1]|uniref:Uncharacterized protein n=1 Tax=Flavobacterium agri TaxID=2743471 RepID=A0A7Y9C659_9FLAO|nr:hypothetical protein [Flavobacterium agri]NUY79877.1 hypothetical protein [Flavobacterium agri]NYA69902.1 hypothetical protein [Flavobacterium agri]